MRPDIAQLITNSALSAILSGLAMLSIATIFTEVNATARLIIFYNKEIKKIFIWSRNIAAKLTIILYIIVQRVKDVPLYLVRCDYLQNVV